MGRPQHRAGPTLRGLLFWVGLATSFAACDSIVPDNEGTKNIGDSCTTADECTSECCVTQAGADVCASSSSCQRSSLESCSVLDPCPGDATNHCMSYDQCAVECDPNAGPRPGGNCRTGQCCLEGSSYGFDYYVCQAC